MPPPWAYIALDDRLYEVAALQATVNFGIAGGEIRRLLALDAGDDTPR